MMDSKQAVELINGLIAYYDAHQAAEIITVKFTDAREIAALIQQQELIIKNAIEYIQEKEGDCPLNAGCNCVEDDDCCGPCPLGGSDEQAEKCWRKLLGEELRG